MAAICSGVKGLDRSKAWPETTSRMTRRHEDDDNDDDDDDDDEDDDAGTPL